MLSSVASDPDRSIDDTTCHNKKAIPLFAFVDNYRPGIEKLALTHQSDKFELLLADRRAKIN